MKIRGLVLAIVAVAVLGALPASASAQLEDQTWVSGVGDDANSCGRTDPCKTFAGAISKTAAGGQIDALDPGGFGMVTITKSITIKADGVEAGVLASGSNAIVVSAGASDVVTLDGLDVYGVSGALVGLKVLSAKNVRLVNSSVLGFQAGVVQAATVPSSVTLSHVKLYGNGVGVVAAPGSNAATATRLLIEDSLIDGGACGVVLGGFGTNASTPAAATNCGTNSSASGISQPVSATVVDTTFQNQTTAGLYARGSTARADIGRDVFANDALALSPFEQGQIVSMGGNAFNSNTNDGAPTSTNSQTEGTPGLAGPPGAAGSNGQDGIQGPTGPTGPAGPTGNTGPSGPAGATGVVGPRGRKGAARKVACKVKKPASTARAKVSCKAAKPKARSVRGRGARYQTRR